MFCHTERLRDHPARLNLVLSDSTRSHPTDPVSSYLSSKHRTKFIPPKPNCFVADLNASFVCRRSSKLRSESGKRTYSITAKRMISGHVLKYLNGECFVIRRGYETTLPVSSSFCLTVPIVFLSVFRNSRRTVPGRTASIQLRMSEMGRSVRAAIACL